MHHHFLLWILAGLVVSRLIFRARMRRMYGGGGCGGGGCGRRFARFGGPIDLGAPDQHRHGRRHFRGWAPWARRWRDAMNEARDQFADAPKPVTDVVGALELNQRQRELYDEVVGKAKASLPVVSLAEALAIVGREPFDRAALDFLVGNAELVDDFEHLHHSLTAEQRAKLRGVTSA